jgi:broad specificity phosphatase PhoE
VTVLLLARHGETDWNRERRWQGHADRPLTPRGVEQARALAARVAGTELDAVYSSDLRRARDTAAAVATNVGLPLEPTPELREVDVGSWSGLTRAEAAARFPAAFARWERGEIGWTDGETYEAMSKRILDAIHRIAGRHPVGRVLVVTHAGPIRAIHAAALGLDVQTYRRMRPVEPNARLSGVCVEDGELTELCSAGRLDDLLAREQETRRKAASQPPTPAG